jgi:hypothetical protein
MTEFSSLLGHKVDDAKPPPPLPAGMYMLQVTGYELGTSSGEKKTPRVRVHFGILEAGEDVDPALLQDVDITKKALRDDMWLTPDALYRLGDFLNALGCHTEGRTFDQVLPEAKGKTIWGKVIQEPEQKGPRIFANITSYTPVE